MPCVTWVNILSDFKGWIYVKLSMHFSVSRTGCNFGCPNRKFRKTNHAVYTAEEINYTSTCLIQDEKNFRETWAFFFFPSTDYLCLIG